MTLSQSKQEDQEHQLNQDQTNDDNIHDYSYNRKKMAPWDANNDNALLEAVKEYQQQQQQPNWRIICLKFHTHANTCQRRWNFLNYPQTPAFSFEEENQIVELATGYVDQNKEIDWDSIGKQLRNKSGTACRKAYIKVMREFWKQEQKAQLTKLVKENKILNEHKEQRANWVEISKSFSGWPIFLLQIFNSEK